eukprot:gene7457-biopygen3051
MMDNHMIPTSVSGERFLKSWRPAGKNAIPRGGGGYVASPTLVEEQHHTIAGAMMWCGNITVSRPPQHFAYGEVQHFCKCIHGETAADASQMHPGHAPHAAGSTREGDLAFALGWGQADPTDPAVGYGVKRVLETTIPAGPAGPAGWASWTGWLGRSDGLAEPAGWAGWTRWMGRVGRSDDWIPKTAWSPPALGRAGRWIREGPPPRGILTKLSEHAGGWVDGGAAGYRVPWGHRGVGHPTQCESPGPC